MSDVQCFFVEQYPRPERNEDGSWTDRQPGMMWFSRHEVESCGWGWDNCSGEHLHVVLPNGHPWCIDSRAGNCTMKGDNLHRCWIRHGDPPNVTVDKDGFTCQAGGGSILSGEGEPQYHGFLRNGVLVTA